MPFDYGTLENTIGVYPSNSRTGMSDPLTFVPQAINFSTTDSMLKNLFVEDDSSLSEFACQRINQFYVYDVEFGLTTGTSSIYLANQMTVPFGVYGDIFSVRRINSDLFYAYHWDDDGAGTIDFRRCSLTSSGATDISVVSVSIPPPPSGFTYSIYGNTSVVDGKKIYVTVTTNSKETLAGVGVVTRKVYGYTYCFDTSLETSTLVSSIILPTLSGNDDYGVSNIYLSSALGVVSTYATYGLVVRTPYIPPFWESINYYSLIDGTTTELFEFQNPTLNIVPPTYTYYRYNYGESIHGIYFPTEGDNYYITINQDGVVVVRTDSSQFPDAVVPITFVSSDTFPKVGKASDNFFWLDAYGKSLGEIVLSSGVEYIHNIFPTLDTANGSIYMSVHMLDGTDQLVLVDPISGSVLTIITLLDAPWGLTNLDYNNETFNHGNFFFHWETPVTSIFHATYIDKVPSLFGLNDSIMLEKN